MSDSKLKKSEILKAVAERAGVSQAVAQQVIDALGHLVTSRVAIGHEVPLFGGTFFKSVREARTGRNPRTGEPVNVPEKRSLKFRSGKGATFS